MRIDLKYQRFGRLLVLEFAGNDSRGSARWKCLCDCAQMVIVRGASLRTGKTTSCGCFGRAQRHASVLKHGDARKASPYHYLYGSWRGHLNHIAEGNRGSVRSRAYAGMPIEPTWFEYLVFRAYALENLGLKPSPAHTLDIINHDKGFVPGNLRWATKLEQTKNRRFLPAMTPQQLLARISDADLIQELARRTADVILSRQTGTI